MSTIRRIASMDKRTRMSITWAYTAFIVSLLILGVLSAVIVYFVSEAAAPGSLIDELKGFPVMIFAGLIDALISFVLALIVGIVYYARHAPK